MWPVHVALQVGQSTTPTFTHGLFRYRRSQSSLKSDPPQTPGSRFCRTKEKIDFGKPQVPNTGTWGTRQGRSARKEILLRTFVAREVALKILAGQNQFRLP